MRPAAPRVMLHALLLFSGLLVAAVLVAASEVDLGEMTDEEYADIYGSGEGDYCRVVGANILEYIRNMEALAGDESLQATLRRSFDFYMYSGAQNATEHDSDDGSGDGGAVDRDKEDDAPIPEGPLPECVFLSADDFRRLRAVFVVDRAGDLLAIARRVTHPLTSALLYTYLYLTNHTAVDQPLDSYCSGARARRVEALARAWNGTADTSDRAPAGLAPVTADDVCATGSPRAACEHIVAQINDLRATVEMIADAVYIAHDVVLGVVRSAVLALSPAPDARNGTAADPPPADGGGGDDDDDGSNTQSFATQMASAARRGAVRTIISAVPPGTTPRRAHFYDTAAAPQRQTPTPTPLQNRPGALADVLTEAFFDAVSDFTNLTLVRHYAPRAHRVWEYMRDQPMGAVAAWLPSARRVHKTYGRRVHDFVARTHALWGAPSGASRPSPRSRSSLIAGAATTWRHVWDAAVGASASVRDEILFQTESFDLAYRAAYAMRYTTRAMHDMRARSRDADTPMHISRYYDTAAHRATEALRAEIGPGDGASVAQRFVDGDDPWFDDDSPGGSASERAYFIFGSSDDPGYSGNAPNENNLFRWTRPGDYVTYVARTVDWALCIHEDRSGCRFCLPEWPSSRYGCRSTEFAQLPRIESEHMPPNDGIGWDCANYVGPIAVARHLFFVLTAQPLAEAGRAVPALVPVLEHFMYDTDGDLPRDIYYCMGHHIATLVVFGLVIITVATAGIILLCALRDGIRAGECTDARAVRRHLARDIARGNRFVAGRLQRLERRARRVREALVKVRTQVDQARASASHQTLASPDALPFSLARHGGNDNHGNDGDHGGGPRRRRT